MSSEQYKRIAQRYSDLFKDEKAPPPNKEQLDRAMNLVIRFIPKSWGGNADEDNPVFSEACRLVSESGLYIPAEDFPSKKKGQPDDEFLMKYGVDEVSALINAACLTIACLEAENEREFFEQNHEKIIIKAMQELYPGKHQLQAKRDEFSLGRS